MLTGEGLRKMKVLWYSNVLLPEAADAAGIEGGINTAGWIEGFLNKMRGGGNRL